MKSPDYTVARMKLVEHMCSAFQRFTETLDTDDDDDALLTSAIKAIPKLEAKLGAMTLAAALSLLISRLSSEDVQAEAAREVLRASIAIVNFEEP